MIPFVNFIDIVLFPLVGIGFLILWLIAMVNAFQGKRFKLPVIGDLAETGRCRLLLIRLRACVETLPLFDRWEPRAPRREANSWPLFTQVIRDFGPFFFLQLDIRFKHVKSESTSPN